MRFKRTIVSIAASGLLAWLAAWSGGAAASGFALLTQSGSGMGNAYAGAGARAEDASTIFSNPAGMAFLHGKQLVVAANLIGVSRQFSDSGSTPATLPARPLGSLADSSERLSWIPNVYFSSEITPKLHLGTGINAPFGSTTEYQPGWVGRYQALKSSIGTINANPSLSYQINEAVAIGVGLDYQRVNAEFTNAKNLPGGDGKSTMSGSDAAWGYNVGALFSLNSGGRIGVAYRSSIQYKLRGAALITTAAGAVAFNQAVTADIKTPDNLSLSYFRALDNNWDVMGELTRTGWSSFKEIRIVQVSTGATIGLTPENWSDTWRIALGASHHFGEQWTARVGLAYDQSPVSDAFRTPRLPDSDRTMLSFGGQYKLNKGSVLDFGYAHLFVTNSTVNNNKGGADKTAAQLVGSYNSRADNLSIQYTHGF